MTRNAGVDIFVMSASFVRTQRSPCYNFVAAVRCLSTIVSRCVEAFWCRYRRPISASSCVRPFLPRCSRCRPNIIARSPHFMHLPLPFFSMRVPTTINFSTTSSCVCACPHCLRVRHRLSPQTTHLLLIVVKPDASRLSLTVSPPYLNTSCNHCRRSSLLSVCTSVACVVIAPRARTFVTVVFVALKISLPNVLKITPRVTIAFSLVI